MNKKTTFLTSMILLLTACAQSGGVRIAGQGSEDSSSRNYPYNPNYTPDQNSQYPNNNNTMDYGDQPRDEDWTVTWRVKQALLADSDLAWSSRFIHVTTSHGIVTLSGNVATKDEMYMIINRVKKVNGVKRVDNEMTVTSS